VTRAWLIYGPPGTSKTVLAKAISFEMGATFLYINCANFWVADGWLENYEKILNEIWGKAKEHKPCLFMFDEFECLYKSFGGPKEIESGDFDKKIAQIVEIRESVLLKFEMSRDDPNYCFFMATSQPWLLSEEVLSLFDEKMFIGLPTWQSIAKYIKDNITDMEHSLTPINILDLGKQLEG
jgi:transitional endoplasmic reticulum ATPase